MNKRPTIVAKEENILDLLSLNPSEPTLYKSYFKTELWSLQEFAALAVGITPDLYKNMANKHTTEVTKTNFTNFARANDILGLLVEDLRNETKSIGLDLLKNAIRTSDPPKLNKVYMLPWSFLKWAAIREIGLVGRFIKCLPLHLKQLYLEFRPVDYILRSCSPREREYHQAYYLRHAEHVINTSPIRLTRTALYNHPEMQNALRLIRKWGGHYSKRAITDKWLSKLENLKRGRPRKAE
jgi:hypothetical protein